MSTDEYVPSEEELVDGYRRKKVTLHGWTYQPVLSRAEIRRGLARVRRDAAREALDGLAAWMSDLHDKYPSHAWYVPLSLDNIARYTTDNYPEETP